ncbi:hypothetical protein DAPPUDRAFT_270522 [Daphnia pulex]|uniref:Endonuclease/exonuclease/phosphatase domain-containing protein n=1 Tax=Daphnia pulex TaxID=6669 RepID=E9I0U8_DAPPU|nr:hypothetical protein DAPPUDRAFT_270522 [Daphnia pulex]|eukprot:EFX62383.1 hypothetical protein DAPPUDRAFT_270522 [Daphnia pulex]
MQVAHHNISKASAPLKPSLVSIPLHLESIFNSIPPAVKKHAFFGIDCNAKSQAWNSVRSDHIGADLELCFLNNALSVSNDIEAFIANLTDSIKSAALKSKLPFHPSRAPTRMPWWSDNMWSLRKKLKVAYKLSRESPSQGNRDAYSHLKAEYQRTLRAGKKESWKSFCSNNLNGDIFGELKKLTLSTPF